MTKHRRPIVAAATGSILVFLLWVWFAPGGQFAAAAFSDVASISAALGASAACLHASHRLRGRTRVGWRLMGLGLIGTTFGESVWGWYDLVLQVRAPAVSIADVGYLTQVPLTLAAMAVLMSEYHRHALRRTLDGLLIAGSFLYVSWATVLSSVYATGGQDTLDRLVTLAYPVSDVATATMAFVMVSHADARARAALTLAGTGLLVLALSDSAFVYVAERGTYSSGDVLDAGWFAAFVLIGLAGLHAADPPKAAESASDSWRYDALPYLPLAVALTTLVVLEFGRTGAAFSLLIGLLLVLAAIARQLVAVRDNLFLRERLEQAMRNLRGREEQLTDLAAHDPLTGLANHALFLDRVEQALARQRRAGTTITVLSIDLDGFTDLNEALGHAAGDKILEATARRLQNCVRPEDTVARLGVDVFAVLLERATAASAGQSLALRIVEQLGAPVPVEGEVAAEVAASVAIVVHPGGPKRVGELLREADCAMYAAKLQGKGHVVTFDPRLRSALSPAGPG